MSKTIKLLCIWFHPDPLWIEDIENNHQSISEVIIDQTPEYAFNILNGDENGTSKIVELCDKYNLPLTILTNTDTFNPAIKQFNHHTNDCPTWWITKTLVQMKCGMDRVGHPIDLLDDAIGTQNNLEHLFISMNNRASPHKCVMIDTLAKHDLIDLGAVSWRDVLPYYDHIRDSLPEDALESVLSGITYKYWTPKRMLLDQPMNGTSSVPHETLPNQYFHSFMQLVPESTPDYFFITEKTTVPLLFNKPFLVLGCKQFHKNLVKLGFQLYDELFDYAFDEEDDLETRCDLIAQNISKFRHCTMHELEQYTEAVRLKLLHNRKLAMQYALNPPVVFKEAADRISTNCLITDSMLVSTFQHIEQYKKIYE
jgi:hypothetical protein